MLVKMDEILKKAREERYGVIAPTLLSFDQILCSIEAAEEKKSPIILNINIRTSWVKKEADLDMAIQMIKQRALRSFVPVCVNLDHGADYSAVLKAIHHGFGSVMIDASALPYEENVEITKKVVENAHLIGIPVEAELGCVGMADPNYKVEWKYSHTTKTDPKLVQDFIEKTNVDFLAISIGNAHGPYAKDIIPHIDFELLKEIADHTTIPLVLHGGSGTGDENLSKACKMGICKINVGTDLLKAGAKEAVDKLNESVNHGRAAFITNYNKAFKEKIMYYMDVFGSTDKA